MQVITNVSVVEVDPNETLLDALKRTEHEVDYQCLAGYCGSCRVKVISGTVRYSTPPLATIGSDEILPCCCTLIEPLRIDCDKILTRDQIQNDMFAPDLFEK